MKVSSIRFQRLRFLSVQFSPEIPETWITGLSDSPEMMKRIAEKGYTPFATSGPRSASSLVSVKERWKEKYIEVGKDPDKMPFAIQRNFVYL